MRFIVFVLLLALGAFFACTPAVELPENTTTKEEVALSFENPAFSFSEFQLATTDNLVAQDTDIDPAKAELIIEYFNKFLTLRTLSEHEHNESGAISGDCLICEQDCFQQQELCMEWVNSFWWPYLHCQEWVQYCSAQEIPPSWCANWMSMSSCDIFYDEIIEHLDEIILATDECLAEYAHCLELCPCETHGGDPL